MGRATLIMLLGSIITFGIVNQSINTRLINSLQASVDYYTDAQTRNMNNSAAQLVISTIASNPNYRTSNAVSLDLFAGTASYTVQDVFFNGDSLIRVTVTSTFNNASKTLTLYLEDPPVGGVVPSTVKATVTSRTDIATSGTLILDGRDHDVNGNLISPISGMPGIWTTGSVSQSGSSKIGGYVGGVDYPPTTSSPGTTTASGQPAGVAAATPDQALGGTADGYPEGTLKAIAVSGIGGSQYATNPAAITVPLSGVTYVELPSGQVWQPLTIQGSGILIVSNSSRDAQMKNLNVGTFRGLMIVDDLIHVHSDIIGGIIILTQHPSAGNCLGNGSGDIAYSTQAIKNATAAAAQAGNITIGAPQFNFGFGKTRLFIKYWYE